MKTIKTYDTVEMLKEGYVNPYDEHATKFLNEVLGKGKAQRNKGGKTIRGQISVNVYFSVILCKDDDGIEYYLIRRQTSGHGWPSYPTPKNG